MRIMPRVGLALAIACVSLSISLTGCSDAFNAGPLEYVESEALTKEVKGEKPISRRARSCRRRFARPSRASTATRRSTSRCLPGSGLPAGGLYLASYRPGGRRGQSQVFCGCMKTRRSIRRRWSPRRVSDRQAAGRRLRPSIAATVCTVTVFPGAGDGPTAPFLYPTPRDYRKGIFKFTSTPSGKPPHRERPAADDLQRLARHVDAGVSLAADRLPRSSRSSIT